MADPSVDARAVTLTASSTQQQQDEGVLQEVLNELDRERKRRAELEATIRKFSEEQDATETSKEEQPNDQIRNLVAITTERDHLVELVDALTSDNDAISAASTSSILPLHVVRLLEIMPWDERVKNYVFTTEEVYQWQVYNSKQKIWANELRNFPPFFRTMPISKPEGSTPVEGSSTNTRSRRLFGGERPPRQCVMTNACVTHVLNINDGFPLPSDGTMWEWIGGWRVNKRVLAVANRANRAPPAKIDCDEEGWSYAENPCQFLSSPGELCWDNPGSGESNFFRRPVRRRQWSRRRALLSYPHASERTEYYLKIMAENAYNEMTSKKLSDQLVETKIQLTECEEKQMTLESESLVKDAGVSKLNYQLTQSNFQLSECIEKLKKMDKLESNSKAKNTTIREFLEPSKKNGDGGEDMTTRAYDGSIRGGGQQRLRLEGVGKFRDVLGGIVSEASSRFKPDESFTTANDSDSEESSSSLNLRKGESDWKKKKAVMIMNKIKSNPMAQKLPSPWRKQLPPSENVGVVPEARERLEMHLEGNEIAQI